MNDAFVSMNPVLEKDIQILRVIRNHCSQFMTRNSEIITEEQQSLWFSSLDKTSNFPFLLNRIHYGVIVESIGYGFNRIENQTVLLTGGLIEDVRGKGYGRFVFNFLVEHAKQFNLPIKLEVLKTNLPARSLYESLGFKPYFDDGTIIKMELQDD